MLTGGGRRRPAQYAALGDIEGFFPSFRAINPVRGFGSAVGRFGSALSSGSRGVSRGPWGRRMGLGDSEQLGSIFSSIGHGIAKGASAIGKGASATYKAAGSGLKAIPGVAGKVGAFEGNLLTLPSRTAFNFVKGVGTSVASGAGKVAGGLLKLPLDVTGALVKGAISPFKSSGGGGGGGEPTSAASSSPSSSVTSSGGGGGGGGGGDASSYGSGGGGGGYGSAGGGSDVEAHPEQALTVAETGMPLWQKIAIGAAAAGGAYILYKKFGKGGRSARRTKR